MTTIWLLVIVVILQGGGEVQAPVAATLREETCHKLLLDLPQSKTGNLRCVTIMLVP